MFAPPPIPKVIAPPEVEPLTIDECRQHLNVTPYTIDSDGNATHPDDALIMAMQGAAREHCEAFLGMSLAMRTLEIALDRFPSQTLDCTIAVVLPLGPVLEILSVTVGEPGSDSGASSGTLAPDAYVLDDYSVPARLLPVGTWPATTGTNAIKVRYLAGYGVDSDGGVILPRVLRSALLLVLGHLYANREDDTEKALATLPLGAEALMRPLRVRLGMA